MIPRLRTLRERAALTQRELGQRAGITQASIQKIETGQQEPHPTTIRKLARALRVKPAELMNGRGA
jgi:transcriptional regulator with XRE-family HTH domain